MAPRPSHPPLDPPAASAQTVSVVPTMPSANLRARDNMAIGVCMIGCSACFLVACPALCYGGSPAQLCLELESPNIELFYVTPNTMEFFEQKCKFNCLLCVFLSRSVQPLCGRLARVAEAEIDGIAASTPSAACAPVRACVACVMCRC